MIYDFSGSTRDLPCLIPGAAHVPVFSEKPPQIVSVNDGVIDPELVPEMAQNTIPGIQQLSGKAFADRLKN